MMLLVGPVALLAAAATSVRISEGGSDGRPAILGGDSSEECDLLAELRSTVIFSGHMYWVMWL